MLRMSRRRRGFALVWAVLQFALPALGALAEAEIARGASSADTGAHVEDRSGPGCRPVHPPDCARCQALSTHAAGVASPAIDWADAATEASPAADGARPALGARLALPLSRAPPHLS